MVSDDGAVQRSVLAALAENHADPMADFEVPPWFQSWTPLTDLARGGDWREYLSSRSDSTRRAVATLAAAGVVETNELSGVRWHQTGDESRPGARRRTLIGEDNESMAWWEYPDRGPGDKRLMHVRLALPEDEAERYRELRRAWEAGP